MRSCVLILLGGMCVFLGVFLIMLKSISVRIKRALVELVLSMGALLIFDVMAAYYNGMPGARAFWGVRISNLIVFLATTYISIAMNSYLLGRFMEDGKSTKVPKRFFAGYLFPCISVFLILISQFNGIVYYIDASNRYVRGSLIVLNYFLIYITAFFQLSALFQYHKLLSSKVFVTSVFFLMLPMVGGIHQLFFPEYYMLDISYGVTAILVFTTTLIEQNNHLVDAYYTEFMTGLPNSHGYISEVGKRIVSGNITAYDAFYLDIRNMSRLNQMYGKDIGDEVIKAFGTYLREHMANDEVVGRLGGNYFVTLIRKENSDEFLKMLQGIPIEITHGGAKRQFLCRQLQEVIQLLKKIYLPSGFWE